MKQACVTASISQHQDAHSAIRSDKLLPSIIPMAHPTPPKKPLSPVEDLLPLFDTELPQQCPGVTCIQVTACRLLALQKQKQWQQLELKKHP